MMLRRRRSGCFATAAGEVRGPWSRDRGRCPTRPIGGLTDRTLGSTGLTLGHLSVRGPRDRERTCPRIGDSASVDSHRRQDNGRGLRRRSTGNWCARPTWARQNRRRRASLNACKIAVIGVAYGACFDSPCSWEAPARCARMSLFGGHRAHRRSTRKPRWVHSSGCAAIGHLE